MDELHELTAAYALDALDPDERRAFEAHLEGCERCRAELASFWEVSGALALAAGGPEPAPALRERVLEAVRAESGGNVVPLEPRRRRAVAPVVGAVAALAAVVAIGLGVWGLSLSSELDDTRTALEQERRAAAVLADPDARSVPLETGSGRLVVAGADGVLVLDGLEAAPAGKTYQAWVVADGTPASAAVFESGGESSVVPLEPDVAEGAVVAVTIEDDGGAEAPTSEPVVASQPV